MSIYHREDSLAALRAQKQAAQQTQEVAACAFTALAESGQISIDAAIQYQEQFTDWQADVAYTVGQLRRYMGQLYRCLQAHTAQTDWTPDAALSLWVCVSTPAQEWPAWRQPQGTHDAYPKGAKVMHNEKRWISNTANNVWEPGAQNVTQWEMTEKEGA